MASLPPLDESLVKALAHPLRWQIVESLVHRGEASPVELARLLDQPLATVSHHVRVLRDQTPIKEFRLVPGDTLMAAPSGTVLEVVHTRGDLYAHRDDNWYWVLLPPDTWGSQRLGWIAGRDVEEAPAPPRPVIAPETTVTPARTESREAASVAPVAVAPAPVPVAANPAPEPVVSEVILHFDFDKSELTAAARAQLDSAVEQMKSGRQVLSVALEGHADWSGPENYNERLGLARAEAVKRHLAEQHQIEVEKMTVVSHGENQPAASNETREGRAQNRRVVVKVGA